ncbi:MAG: glycoside hydrolase family 2 protein, partial [Chloroflexi bacterium]|nr:glycoside hydrolase family 2 protein [Chloroflexota bacterium]
MKTTRTRIDTGWQVRAVPSPDMNPALELPPLPAEVPGHVHLDLQRNGVIPDPFYRLQERDVAWVDDADWVYRATFRLDPVPDGDLLLRFLGLDTVAEIRLNGRPLGQTDNMFVP